MMKKLIAAASFALLLTTTTAIAEPTAQLAGGRTTVWLSSDFLHALDTLGVAPSAISPGRLNARKNFVRFGIPAGVIDLDSLAGDVFHKGGLVLEVPGTKVSLYNFVISTTGDSPVLTGIAAVNGDVVDRIPLFDLELTREPVVGKWGSLSVGGVKVTLNTLAADTLNAVFQVDAFAEGLKIGGAHVRTQIVGVSDEDVDDEAGDDWRGTWPFGGVSLGY
jgi:hypothetical protein